MDNNKMLLGVYDNPDTTLDVTKSLKEKGYDVYDVYTPFAVHNLDRVLGVKRSRLSSAAFVFAMTGLTSAVSLQSFTSYFDWPMLIGGKPFLHIPTYIPITFELAILCTAFGMVGCFFAVNKMVWGKNADIIDIRVTDDLFVVAIDIIPNKTDIAELSSILKNNGAIEIREREFED